MSAPAVVTAGELPTEAAGSRAPGWWGIVLLILIEITVFSVLITSYFYLRGLAESWPPAGISPPDLLLPTINTVVLLASCVPMYLAERGIRQGNQGSLRLWLAVSFVLGAIFLVVKVYEYSQLPYTWSSHAYGSIVFTMTGFHLAHVIAGLLKNAGVQAVAWQGFFTARRYLAIQTTALYWYFVTFIWLPLYATIYLSPRWF